MNDVLVSRDGAVLVLTLARPQKKNALTSAMYEALIAAFESADRDEDISVILLRGSGGVFTAGNDIGDFIAHAQFVGDVAAVPLAAHAGVHVDIVPV